MAYVEHVVNINVTYLFTANDVKDVSEDTMRHDMAILARDCIKATRDKITASIEDTPNYTVIDIGFDIGTTYVYEPEITVPGGTVYDMVFDSHTIEKEMERHDMDF